MSENVFDLISVTVLDSMSGKVSENVLDLVLVLMLDSV